MVNVTAPHDLSSKGLALVNQLKSVIEGKENNLNLNNWTDLYLDWNSSNISQQEKDYLDFYYKQESYTQLARALSLSVSEFEKCLIKYKESYE